MILGFDVGNTTTVIGCFDKRETMKLITSFRISTQTHITPDELFFKVTALIRNRGIDPGRVEGIVFSSVVPPVDFIFYQMFQESFAVEAIIVNVHMNTGLEFRYENIEEIGADRIVNAVAARKLYAEKGDMIIIDFGTATTFCVLLKEGIYQGGIIAPGLRMSMDALFQKTSKLPKISFTRPTFVVGTSTRASLQSGFFYGWSSMLTGMIDLIEKQLQRSFFVVLTGGYASTISPAIERPHLVDEDLTLKGLRILYEMNTPKSV